MTDYEHERRVLGALLLFPMEALEACVPLRADMFALDSHRRIHSSLVAQLAEGGIVDYLRLSQALERAGVLDSVGAYIADLESRIPNRFNPTVQVAEVVERYKKRQIVRICDACKATPGFADDVLTRMQAQVLEVLSESIQQDDRICPRTRVPYLTSGCCPQMLRQTFYLV